VDDEIDELLSDDDEPTSAALPGKGRGGRDGKGREWKCGWEGCGEELPDQPGLVKHLHSGE
jgi:hypothetical protein